MLPNPHAEYCIKCGRAIVDNHGRCCSAQCIQSIREAYYCMWCNKFPVDTANTLLHYLRACDIECGADLASATGRNNITLSLENKDLIGALTTANIRLTEAGNQCSVLKHECDTLQKTIYELRRNMVQLQMENERLKAKNDQLETEIDLYAEN